MEFIEWLQKELNSRGWDQSELARRANLSSGSVSNVMTGLRNAGPDFCIAIAKALGVPREEVFRARGWLLRDTQPVAAPDADPRLVTMAESVRNLPSEDRDKILLAWQAVLIASGKWDSHPYPSKVPISLDLISRIERSRSFEPIPRWKSGLWFHSIVYTGTRERGYYERIDVDAGGTKRVYLDVDVGIVYVNNERFLDEYAQVNWGYGGQGTYTLAKFLLEHFIGEQPTIYVVGALAENVLAKLKRDVGWKITGRALHSWLLDWEQNNSHFITDREEELQIIKDIEADIRSNSLEID